MGRTLRGLLLFLCAGAFSARPQPTATPQQPAGLESDWEIAPVFQKLSEHGAKLMPMLDKLDAKAWMERGAPQAYADQLKSCRDQARALADNAKAMAADPQKLSGAMQVLFREQGLETMLGSLAEAMRRYQGTIAAQELVAVAAEAGAERDRLQQYVVNLASEREREYSLMDREAQRCRGMVLAPPSTKKKK